LLFAAAHQFRTDPWVDQPEALMVACEKHGLAGILRQVTQKYRVPLATLGGACSASFEIEIARWFAAQKWDAPITILYLGDFDPSGVQIPVWLYRDVLAFTEVLTEIPVGVFQDKLQIKRLAINSLEQARGYGAVSRPTKKEDNSHVDSVDWPLDEATGELIESVEVHSIPPAAMQQIAEDAIREHLDVTEFEASLEDEAAARARLMDWIATYYDGAG
jgi:hypothetical protein